MLYYEPAEARTRFTGWNHLMLPHLLMRLLLEWPSLAESARTNLSPLFISQDYFEMLLFGRTAHLMSFGSLEFLTPYSVSLPENMLASPRCPCFTKPATSKNWRPTSCLKPRRWVRQVRAPSLAFVALWTTTDAHFPDLLHAYVLTYVRTYRYQ